MWYTCGNPDTSIPRPSFHLQEAEFFRLTGIKSATQNRGMFRLMLRVRSRDCSPPIIIRGEHPDQRQINASAHQPQQTQARALEGASGGGSSQPWLFAQCPHHDMNVVLVLSFCFMVILERSTPRRKSRAAAPGFEELSREGKKLGEPLRGCRHFPPRQCCSLHLPYVACILNS